MRLQSSTLLFCRWSGVTSSVLKAEQGPSFGSVLMSTLLPWPTRQQDSTEVETQWLHTYPALSLFFLTHLPFSFLPSPCPWWRVLCQHHDLDKDRCDLQVCLIRCMSEIHPWTEPRCLTSLFYRQMAHSYFLVSKSALLPPISRCCWPLEAIWMELS